MPCDDNEYFVDAIDQYARNPPCTSVGLRNQLRTAAISKNGQKYDKSDTNLLFPTDVITSFLSKGNVTLLLGCNCTVCRDLPGGRDVLSDGPLLDILTQKTGPDADETRRKFCALLFMGTGFTVRHICSFDNRGLEISDQREFLKQDLFEPLHARGLFKDLSDSTELTERFIAIFKETQQVFRTPKFDVGDFKKTFLNTNFPFLREEPLLKGVDRRGRAELYKFSIHPEFRGSLPSALIRKESKWKEGDTRERDALHLIAQSKQLNLIQLLCWYRYENNVNYIFEHYPCSLEQILDGTTKEPPNARPPARYHGSQLQHWLWQGVVDAMSALAFFHTPVSTTVALGDLNGAHCDLKPPNILVDSTGNLIVTDFEHAQLIPRNQRGSNTRADLGDLNYQPPVPSTSSGAPRVDVTNPVWLQACDVWAMACIIIEVIEFVRSNNGPERLKEFRSDRKRENESNRAFWIAIRDGYGIRKSVRSKLNSFRSTRDQYLNSVTNLLERMLSINPFDRPTMAQCATIVSQNVPTDEWPLLESGEVSISGLGASTLLRNMPTRFARRVGSSWDERRLKMYLLLNTSSKYKRMRLALEFKAHETEFLNQGDASTAVEKSREPKVTYVISDSARLSEEVYKPLSFFDRNYNPEPDRDSKCSFGVIHPNLQFIFEQPFDYFHFLTATTRQEICIFDDGKQYKYSKLPTKSCRIRPSGLSLQNNTLNYGDGRVQIWKELLDAEFIHDFMPSLHSTSVDRRESFLNSPAPNNLDRATPISRTSHSRNSSVSDESSHASTVASSPLRRPKYRLVLLLHGPPARYLTIQLTSGLCDLQFQKDANRKSLQHLTIRSKHKGSFRIGNFSAEDGFPGIPLEPRVFEQAENVEVNWVEIEFQSPEALKECNQLCVQALKNVPG